MNNNLFSQIRSKWSCLQYARQILGLPVNHEGDRCTSLAPGPHTHTNALVIENDHWIDYTWGKHGDVIDLCALTRHNGDIKAAIRELAPELLHSFNSASYVKHQASLTWLINQWHKALRPENREYLHSRRITDETIDKLKIGYSPTAQRLITPYWKNGQVVYYSARDTTGRWKVDPNNHPKYKKMCRKGKPFTENTIWGLDSLADDFCGDIHHDPKAAERHRTLCIIEGQVDALSFWQEKYHVISPVGGFFANGLLPVVRSIAKNFERVFICFDNDPSGEKFRNFMCRFMFKNNIPFICGHTQHPDGSASKFDVSDHYTKYGTVDDLVANAVPGLDDLAASFRPGLEKEFAEFMSDAARWVKDYDLKFIAKKIIANGLDKEYVNDVVKEARRGLRERALADALLKKHKLIHFPGDGFFEYEHGVWVKKPDAFIQRYTRDLIGLDATVKRMLAVAKHAAIVNSADTAFNAKNILNMQNGILDLHSLKLLPHSDVYMTTIQLKYGFDRTARNLDWENFISQIMEGNQQKIRYLQQQLAKILDPENPEETALMLMGDGANGKSVLIEVLRRVFGEDNCSDVELCNFADRFEPMAMQHSLVNFSNETNVNIRGAEAAIKKVISQQTIRASKKGVDAIHFTPRCKIICACNSYINSNDLTHGFLRRFNFIKFNRTFSKDEADPHLIDKLCKNLPGILNWLIDGYMDYKRNGFIDTEENAQTKEEFMLQYNPLATFIKYGLGDMSDVKITPSDLYYSVYVPWAEKAHTGILQISKFFTTFASMIKRLRPDVVKTPPLHGYVAYYFPPQTEETRVPTAEEIFDHFEQQPEPKPEPKQEQVQQQQQQQKETPPAMTYEPTEPVSQPQIVIEPPKYDVKMPPITDKQLEFCQWAVKVFEANGDNIPQPPEEHHSYIKDLPPDFEPMVFPWGAKTYRAWCEFLEELMMLLKISGLPHTLKWALRFYYSMEGIVGAPTVQEKPQKVVEYVMKEFAVKEE